MVQNYPAPSAGGDYGAPTPHSAAVAHEPYMAPTDQAPSAGTPAPHGGFDAMEHGLGAPTPTPGEAAETPERYDET